MNTAPVAEDCIKRLSKAPPIFLSGEGISHGRGIKQILFLSWIARLLLFVYFPRRAATLSKDIKIISAPAAVSSRADSVAVWTAEPLKPRRTTALAS